MIGSATLDGQRFADRLHRAIAAGGPIPVSAYMGQANAHYYAARDPLGTAGDFTTAPEISQMFGELLGLWLADLWQRAGRPDVHFVELGPGRGTLAADALRAMAGAGLRPPVQLVETSPALRAAQRLRLPDAHWHHDLSTLPDDAALLVVANEFFDALPIRQLVRAPDGWRERLVVSEGERFRPVPGPRAAGVPLHLADAPEGSVLETSPASAAVAAELGRRLATQSGAALIVDYGHARTAIGDTLQAVSRHAFADPWLRPGEVDLTAHVNFEALALAATCVHSPRPESFVPTNGIERESPTTAWPVVEQGALLKALGIDARAAALARAQPGRAEEIELARHRLTAPDQMGSLFKALALTAPGWPAPAGFA